MYLSHSAKHERLCSCRSFAGWNFSWREEDMLSGILKLQHKRREAVLMPFLRWVGF
ncbi:uncharacterized protein LACBIDRAFT_299374 [Laccaria bicolor S238N-H82]|uniref:Predicted protein n=1 Tax=Laccaria bicolor (strain S238N-H82 / ATCC MYA-4686) TaxID=486041 RepID=B0DEL1_LACBS|nr:uncharacterized protein LACBIDRAFT_299374 [Laccaria bicolor S238N-H82]EDR06953.1 predicted protein [Laccaria bicolor S238N-H82]|eukprot:XP_001882326.1 predicted protein [Laccaria bicolor S238N-H82]